MSRSAASRNRSTKNMISGSAFDCRTCQSGVPLSRSTCGRAAAINRATWKPSPCFALKEITPATVDICSLQFRLGELTYCLSDTRREFIRLEVASLHWHIGETNTRFANVISRIARGSNRSVIGRALPYELQKKLQPCGPLPASESHAYFLPYIR